MSTWRCPYCNQNATLVNPNISRSDHTFNNNNKDGNSVFGVEIVVCPNSACKEYTVSGTLHDYYPSSQQKGALREFWKLKPQSSAKPVPDYVPQAIRDDYKESCLIVDLSPKASATLSRRCLQGMIRDFHKIVKKRLVDEIDALHGQIDQQTWNAIDALRKLGNIGAHMETDINMIIDVDPGEAQLLIELIETLLEEWYVRRHERDLRMNKIIATAAAKQIQKAKPASAIGGDAARTTP